MVFDKELSDPKELEKDRTAKSPFPVIPPILTKEVEIRLSDFKEGEMIAVLADHDIKMETQFTAIKIVINQAGPAGFVPPKP